MYCKTDNSYSHSGNVRQIVGSCKKLYHRRLFHTVRLFILNLTQTY